MEVDLLGYPRCARHRHRLRHGVAVQVMLEPVRSYVSGTISGTSTTGVLDLSPPPLPGQMPQGGTESVRDLYDHYVYHPPTLYGEPPCDPDSLVGDLWEVLAYAQDALGTQLLGLILGARILPYRAARASRTP
jgi:hypothetical protein